MLDPIIQEANIALESTLTDQDISKQCPSLKPEDIHTIRKSNTNLAILPYIALKELAELGKQRQKALILHSPLQEKEYAIFKERLGQHFRFFREQQEAKFSSEQSQMDDLIVAQIMDDVKDELLQDESQLLHYFELYLNELNKH